ncbi:MAG: hypothetical protein N3C60_09280 [Calditerrivibrio sp.]|nr:hypothetical protein [Calditerrivibrio sp.]
MSTNEEKKFDCCTPADADCGCEDENCYCEDAEYESCSCGCDDEEGFINIENVTEVALDQNGTVHLLVVDDDGNNPQEYAIEFPSYEQAESWIRENFGDDIFEEE